MKKILILMLAAAALTACGAAKISEKTRLADITYAEQQTRVMLATAGEPTGGNFPRNTNGGKFYGTNDKDWTSGFFPGQLWLLYHMTGNAEWRTQAEKWTAKLTDLRHYTGTHDLGFMMGCSFGLGERFTGQYRDVLKDAADALITRWSPHTGTIKSWNGWQSWDEPSFEFPVIIDNMMNLELLFRVSQLTGDKKYYDIAIAHADATLKNHFRPDGSTFHVVAYDPVTGEVLARKTAQGYADASTWARGQAWAIYGFTMVARETGEKRFLDAAVKATEWWLEHLPGDMVPYWDFNRGQAAYKPGARSYATRYQGIDDKDASAAAVVASALLELSELAGRRDFREKAVATLLSLSSPVYRAPVGTNAGFLLMHSVGSIPNQVEIDVPLVYADYYYIEALNRL